MLATIFAGFGVAIFPRTKFVKGTGLAAAAWITNTRHAIKAAAVRRIGTSGVGILIIRIQRMVDKDDGREFLHCLAR